MIPAVRMIQRNALVYRRVWHGSFFSSFLQPTLFLVSFGMGVGGFVDRGGGTLPGGVDFLHFLAPGLLAAAAMQTASFESSWPVLSKLTLERTYEAVHATPMRILDLVMGELAWIAIRQTMVAAAFVAVMTAFGIPRSLLVLLTIPAAVLTGLAFSAPMMAYAAMIPGSGNNFNPVFRFVLTPLFLFSDIFFPIGRLPVPFQWLAWCTPLFHGVQLVRGLTLNSLEPRVWLIHVAYLLGLTGVGALAAIWAFRRKLSA
jgi:lipooligosaccharide transport system permease protein